MQNHTSKNTYSYIKLLEFGSCFISCHGFNLLVVCYASENQGIMMILCIDMQNIRILLLCVLDAIWYITFWNKFQGVTKYSETRALTTWTVAKKLMAKTISTFATWYLLDIKIQIKVYISWTHCQKIAHWDSLHRVLIKLTLYARESSFRFVSEFWLIGEWKAGQGVPCLYLELDENNGFSQAEQT